MKHLIFYMVLLPMLTSCRQTSLTKDELWSYLEDPENGVLKQSTRNNVEVEAIYYPKDFIVQQELVGISDDSATNEVHTRLDSVDYFVLRFSKEGKEIETQFAGSSSQFLAVVNYLSYEIVQDVSLIHETDTVEAMDALYTQGFGMKNTSTVLMVFKSKLHSRRGTCRLLLEDTRLGSGRTEFNFDLSKIHSLPRLKF